MPPLWSSFSAEMEDGFHSGEAPGWPSNLKLRFASIYFSCAPENQGKPPGGQAAEAEKEEENAAVAKAQREATEPGETVARCLYENIEYSGTLAGSPSHTMNLTDCQEPCKEFGILFRSCSLIVHLFDMSRFFAELRVFNKVNWPDRPRLEVNCRNTVGCAHFTFYPKDGSCKMYGLDAIWLSMEGAMSGPSRCVAQVRLTLENLGDMTNLQDEQQVLQVEIAMELAKSAGIPVHDIRDMEGQVGKVTMTKDQTVSGKLVLDSFIDMPAGSELQDWGIFS